MTPARTPRAEQIQRARTPYTVTEQNFTIRALQPRGANRHAVFFTHAREAISYHYERNPADPRIQHALTLEVDDYGNVLKQAAIGYGRRTQIRVVDAQGNVQQVPNPGLAGLAASRSSQADDAAAHLHREPRHQRHRVGRHAPHPAALRGAHLRADRLRGHRAGRPLPGLGPGRARPRRARPPAPQVHRAEVAYEATATGNQRRRPIEWLRTLYRRDDLSGLLPLGELQPLAPARRELQARLHPGLLAQVFQRPRAGQPPEAVAARPGGGARRPGRQTGAATCKARRSRPTAASPRAMPTITGGFRPGQSFFSTNPADNAATELAQARQHFFLPRRYRDPFGQDAFVDFDANDLLMVETRDALGNRVTVDANDYRVLQPRLVSDPNRNQTEVAFDTLGMVVGTAVMGKPLPAPAEGDTLTGFVADLTQAQLDAFFDAADPHASAPALLQDATTRIVYDLDRFRRTQQANPDDPTKWQPACAATLARETHVSAPLPPQGLKIQLSFSYSDGFGREIQKKIQAEPGPVVEGGPVVNPRWVGSGWTIFNNKGKPVRQYEPFFSATHRFEFGVHGRRQPGAVLRPGRARHRHAAPEPHLREGGVRPLAADHLRRQRHLRAAQRADRRPAHRPRHRRLRRRVLQDAAGHLADLARAAHRRRPRAQTSATPPCAPQRMPTRPPPRTSTPWAAPS